MTKKDPKIVEAETKTLALAKELKPFQTKWLTLEKITKPAQMTGASTILAWCRTFKSNVELERKELVKPLNTVVKKINAKYKEITTPVDNLATHLATIMAIYDQEQRALAAAKVEKEAKKAEKKGQKQYAHNLRETALNTKPELKLEGLQARDKWYGEIIDLTAALKAFIKGLPALHPATPEITEAIRRAACRVAGTLKSEDIGIPGCRGVRETTFSRK